MRYNTNSGGLYKLALIPLLVFNMYCGKQVVKQDAMPKDAVAAQDSSKYTVAVKDTSKTKDSAKKDTLDKKVEDVKIRSDEGIDIKTFYNIDIRRIVAGALGVKPSEVRLIKGRNGLAEYGTTRMGFCYLLDIVNTVFRNTNIDIDANLDGLILRAANYVERYEVAERIDKRKVVITEGGANSYRQSIKGKFKRK